MLRVPGSRSLSSPGGGGGDCRASPLLCVCSPRSLQEHLCPVFHRRLYTELLLYPSRHSGVRGRAQQNNLRNRIFLRGLPPKIAPSVAKNEAPQVAPVYLPTLCLSNRMATLRKAADGPDERHHPLPALISSEHTDPWESFEPQLPVECH